MLLIGGNANSTIHTEAGGMRIGDMYGSGGSPTLTHVTFSGNTASCRYGGGMWSYQNSKTVLTSVTFSGNTANGQGGRMYNCASNPTLTNVTFGGNVSSAGGAILNGSNSNSSFTNITFR